MLQEQIMNFLNYDFLGKTDDMKHKLNSYDNFSEKVHEQFYLLFRKKHVSKTRYIILNLRFDNNILTKYAK